MEAERLFKQALKAGESCYRRSQQLQHHSTQYEAQHSEYSSRHAPAAEAPRSRASLLSDVERLGCSHQHMCTYTAASCPVAISHAASGLVSAPATSDCVKLGRKSYKVGRNVHLRLTGGLRLVHSCHSVALLHPVCPKG